MGGPHTRLKLFLPECSRVYLPQRGTALGLAAAPGHREGGGGGGRCCPRPWGRRDLSGSITPPRSPVLCPHPERAPDILVGVGLGCLLQMTSSQLAVKVRPR